MLNITNVAIEDRVLRQSAAANISQTIRGAQHEIAFGQLLAATGRYARPASLEEDLAGVDYIVDDGTGSSMYIDVKASLSEIEARGSKDAYSRAPNGRIIMYSLVRDSELQGGFYLDGLSVANKAPVLDTLLTQVQQAA